MEPLLADALRVANRIAPPTARRPEVLRDLDGDTVRNPTVGLRRWIVRADEIRSALGLSDVLHLELHHDGSSSLTANVEAWLEREPAESSAVPTRMVEAAIADGVAVGTAHARRLGYNGGIAVQTTLVSVFLSKPMVAFDNATGGRGRGGAGPVRGGRSIRRILPVKVEVSATAEVPTLRSAVRQLALDILHQFGVARTTLL